MNRQQRRIVIRRSDAEETGWLTAIILFIIIIGVVSFIATPLWHSQIKAAKHNHGWHTTPATVITSEANTNQDGTTKTKLATFSYTDLKNHKRTEILDVPNTYVVGDVFDGWINNKGTLYVPHVNNRIGNPFAPAGSFWEVPTVIIVFGVFANLIFSGLVGLITCEALDVKGHFYWPPKIFLKKESLYGMPTREVTERKLVHNPDGSITETTTTKRL